MTKLYWYIGTTLVVLLGIWGVIHKWNSMTSQITTLKQDKNTLQSVVDSQKDTISLLNQDKERVNKLIEARRIEQQELDKSISSLKKAISGLNSKEAVVWKSTQIPKDVLEQIND